VSSKVKTGQCVLLYSSINFKELHCLDMQVKLKY